MLCNAALMVRLSNFYSSFKHKFSRISCSGFKLFENQTVRLSRVHCTRHLIGPYTSAVGYDTVLQVAGSIPDGVIGIFYWHNPSGRTVALGSTQPLAEMSTWNISWGSKDDRCVGLTILPTSCADCLEMWEPQLLGTLRACPGLYRDCFTLRYLMNDFTSEENASCLWWRSTTHRNI
jgi:hypothetical protein